ncbi:hypothetical protein WJX73_000135 [Symbiochloris irregularis]|uniref:DUF7798 domain-containing protein n=1 Tax=Symbiochloris irregularis TaxID=706552 RepID=A0AAW1NWU7_9CHLO
MMEDMHLHEGDATESQGVSEQCSAVSLSDSSLAGRSRRVGAMLESSFEELSRQARGLLQNEHAALSASTSSTGDLTQHQGAADEQTFEHAFLVHGGQQVVEELEALGSDCARQLKRLRTRLPLEGQASLDALASTLGPYFDIQNDLEGDQALTNDASNGPLGQGHAVIAHLCGEGIGKTEELVAEAKLQRAGSPAFQAAVRVQGLGAEALAEVASLCLERLLALGRSLAASTRYGKPTDDGIQWPQDPTAVTAMLRGQGRRMLEDVEALGQAFLDALAELYPIYKERK